jgi:hypothetical protein
LNWFKTVLFFGLFLIIIVAVFVRYPSAMVAENPFNLGIARKEHLTHADYLQIQKVLALKQNQLEKLIREMYPANCKGYATPEDFIGRCSRGVYQVLIDPGKGWFPEMRLEKIGSGGDRCIVTNAPYLRIYPELVRSKTQQLKDVGFNGYYLYFIGGYPNPTGAEIQYVGVPYAIKIFAMLEAQKRGFQKVIWVDSAAMPIRDPAPLFERLEKTGAFIDAWSAPDDLWKYVLPQTRELLKELTGTDVLQSNYVYSIVFGMKMNTMLAKTFVRSYFKMLELGRPFLSCFPEECVFSAIYGQKKYKKKWKPAHFPELVIHEDKLGEGPDKIETAIQRGAFFINLRH